MGERLTQGDIDKIKKEIEYRTLVVRKEAIEAVSEARAQGDLSENFEYYAAKKDKNQNESRIRYLERMLKNSVVVSDTSRADEVGHKNESRIRYLERMLKNATVISDESQEGVVGLNKTIELYIEEMEEVQKFKLVTSVRCDSIEGKISIESPLGKAINGHREGDRVYVKVNEKMGYYAVIRSITDGDDSEDEIRPY